MYPVSVTPAYVVDAPATPPRVMVHLAGTFLMAAIMGFKNSHVNPENFGEYFTTWMWVLLLAWLVIAIVPLQRPDLMRPVATALLFTTHGACWLVYILFTAVVYSNPDSFLRFEKGLVTFGALFLGEKVTHGLPLIVMLVYVMMHVGALRRALRPMRPNSGDPAAMTRTAWTCLVLFWWFASPLVLLGIYAAFHDAWQTYRSKLAYWEAAVVSLGAVGISNGLLLFALVYRGVEK